MALVVGLGWVARDVPRAEWELLILSTGLLSLGTLVWIKQATEGMARWEIWGWGWLFRAVILGTFPLWSDDVVRFYWDAWVAQEGLSPYAHTPRSLLTQMPAAAQAIFPQLNSPDYYSVYLPWHQQLFQWALGDGVDLSTFVWRLQWGYAVIETGVWAVIFAFSTASQAHRWKWLYWQPIWLLEFLGNLHVEGLVAVFLVATYIAYLSTDKVWISVLLFAGSVAWKWTPLLWVPLGWVMLRGRDRWKALGVGGIGLGLLTYPVVAHLATMGQSLDLYFQRFEFNASLYYLARAVGQALLGYNPIGLVGPMLSLLAMVGIGYTAFRTRIPVSVRAYYSYGVYLALATTVHPWYVIPWVVVGVLAGRTAPWVGLWCLGWSYHAYSVPEQSVWGYALLGTWTIAEEFIWWRRQVLPATRAEDFLRRFFQYLSPNSPAATKLR